MAIGSLRPVLEMDVPDLAAPAWLEVVRRALTRSREIADHRRNYPAMTDEHNDDWRRLHRFEYQHFYAGWIAVAFRLQACASHAQAFTDLFAQTHGAAQNGELLQEDDALFGFFVKGIAGLESFAYALYAFGALVCTPNDGPSAPPPAQFPRLDPTQPRQFRGITIEETRQVFARIFPNGPLTGYFDGLVGETTYMQWQEIRNVLAHRVATAGRDLQYAGPGFDDVPIRVTHWAGDLELDAATTSARFDWLKATINRGIEATATFAAQQLPYREDQLPPLP